MKINYNIIIVISVVIIIFVLGVWFYAQPKISLAPVENQPAGQFIVAAKFFCDKDKTIDANFYSGKTISSTDPNIPPIPGGSVSLKLSDGRNMNLPHVISADGGRYANADESFVFWNRGDTAFINENNIQTYSNCITSSGNKSSNQ
jgi:membrane-bound inhibitor of C-type lysozyme